MERLVIYFAYIAIIVLNQSLGDHHSIKNNTEELHKSHTGEHKNVTEKHQVKAKTFFDYQTHVIVYKDLVESKCFIERMQLDGNYHNGTDQELPRNIFRKRARMPDIKLSKRKAYTLAGARVVEFCHGFPTYLLQQYQPDSNVLDYYGYANDENEIDHTRYKRQTQNYFVGRSHGQTQSQYMQFGNGNSPGKAEAEASFGVSKAIVSGSSGMGSAQSQSSPFGCDGCYNQEQGFQFNGWQGAPIREPIGPPGYAPGYQPGGTYVIPPGYKPGGGGVQPGYRPGGHIQPGGEGGIPPGYRPGGQIQPGGEGGIPPGYRPGGQVTPPGGEGGIPPGYRPGGQIQPGGEGGIPPGYRPGGQVAQPGGQVTYPGGSTYPGEHPTYPNGNIPPGHKPGYKPGYFGGQFSGDFHTSTDQGKFSGVFSGTHGYKPNDNAPAYVHHPNRGQFSGSFEGQYGEENSPDFHKPGSWGGQTSGEPTNGGPQYENHNGNKKPTQTFHIPGYETGVNQPQHEIAGTGPQSIYHPGGRESGLGNTNNQGANKPPFENTNAGPQDTNPAAVGNTGRQTNQSGFGNAGNQATNQPNFGNTGNPVVNQPGYDLGHENKFDNSGKPNYGGDQTGTGAVPGAWPTEMQQDDDAYSQVQTSVQQLNNETQASANAQGRYLGGNAHSQVSGTYSGSGSFSASAGTNDGKRGALTQVSGGKKGAISSAQGSGGRSQSQTQVQYFSETSDTAASAQTSGWNQGTNTQVQGGAKGGLADAQANGPGSTSSQAQIGFIPQDEHQVVIGPRRGATANAQSGSYSGQSQVQVQGQFLHGIQYTGSAQAGSGRKLVPRNQSQFESLSYSFPSFKPLQFNSPKPVQDIQVEQNLNSSSTPVGESNKVPEPAKPNLVEVTTVPPTNYEENNTEEDDDYDSQEAAGTGSKRHIISQATRSQKQHIVLDPLEEIDAFVTQVQGDPDLKEGMVIQPGQQIPGTYGYQVPQGFRGVVKAVSSGPYTAATGQNSQAQTVSIVPGHGEIIYQQPTYAVSSQTGTRNGYYSYGSGYTYQPAVQNHLRAGVNNPTFVSSSTSETGYQNPSTGKRIPSVYYSQSSTCGYFTNTCIFNGKNRICYPKSRKGSDGSPAVC